MMLILSIFILTAGFLMLVKPDAWWEITESWKSSNAAEPSDFYIKTTRFGGCIFVLAGFIGIIGFCLL
jgi:hypothetical protein